ncbi:hypothetical protein L6164_001731 [Bauhinia variegata]|uniref:Uncharacterized protein n=1 Tax=Bauhinia variegata TaxID=167791 RepID=A0ACB9QAI6_BAUVA|nr:hypothetical protein L6164_001731 [Bauhinia variegata]
MGEALGEENGDGKKEMAAIDESEYSHYALISFFGAACLYSPVSARPNFVTSYTENQNKFALALLEKAKSICESHGVNAETITEEGDPRTAICNAVEKYNIDLLVLGECGLGKIKRAIVGSVSNYCLHNAKCTVLVAKKPK